MGIVHRRAFLAASAASAVAPNFACAQAPNLENLGWGRMSRAARDAAYNVVEAVADTQQIVEGLDKASAALRARRPQHVDVAYGPGDRNKWDIFPGNDPKAPCLVFIHGGYWQVSARERYSCLAEGVLTRGWSAALPGYTLAPAASLTQIAQEIRSSLDWLAAEGGTHGVAGPIILSGHSAGGHLTAMVLDHPSVRAGLAIAGLFELGPIRDTYLNERLKLTEEEIAALSPLRLSSVSRPLAISYGTAELPALVRDSRAYHQHRARSHLPGSLIPIPKANHFTILEELRSPNGALTRTVVRLIEDSA
jgi:arylformamidase